MAWPDPVAPHLVAAKPGSSHAGVRQPGGPGAGWADDYPLVVVEAAGLDEHEVDGFREDVALPADLHACPRLSELAAGRKVPNFEPGVLGGDRAPCVLDALHAYVQSFGEALFAEDLD